MQAISQLPPNLASLVADACLLNCSAEVSKRCALGPDRKGSSRAYTAMDDKLLKRPSILRPSAIR